MDWIRARDEALSHSKISLLAAGGAALLFFTSNYCFYHAGLFAPIRGTAIGYFFGVQLPFGIIVPGLALSLFVRAPDAPLSAIGISLGRRDVISAAIALALSAALAAFPVGTLVMEPGGMARAATLFCQLLTSSTAEVLVFTGLLFTVIQSHLRDSRRWSTPVAVVASSMAFGVFHFTYPEPWNNWTFALGLSVVWIGVSIVYVASRSLLAAIVFNNNMAVLGFLQNDLKLPGTAVGSLAGWVFAIGASLVAVLVASNYFIAPRRE